MDKLPQVLVLQPKPSHEIIGDVQCTQLAEQLHNNHGGTQTVTISRLCIQGSSHRRCILNYYL